MIYIQRLEHRARLQFTISLLDFQIGRRVVEKNKAAEMHDASRVMRWLRQLTLSGLLLSAVITASPNSHANIILDAQLKTREDLSGDSGCWDSKGNQDWEERLDRDVTLKTLHIMLIPSCSESCTEDVIPLAETPSPS